MDKAAFQQRLGPSEVWHMDAPDSDDDGRRYPLPNLVELGLKRDDLFICRDVALTDEQAANLAL